MHARLYISYHGRVHIGFGQAVTLEQAFASAENRTNVVNARLELANARADLERAQADPLITRIPLLQAQQRFATALADFERVYYEALTEIAVPTPTCKTPPAV